MCERMSILYDEVIDFKKILAFREFLFYSDPVFRDAADEHGMESPQANEVLVAHLASRAKEKEADASVYRSCRPHRPAPYLVRNDEDDQGG